MDRFGDSSSNRANRKSVCIKKEKNKHPCNNEIRIQYENTNSEYLHHLGSNYTIEFNTFFDIK